MNLLFEEDGVFRAGSVLSSTEASHQVELASGKRTKVKSAHVLLHFDDVSAARLLEAHLTAHTDRLLREAFGVDLKAHEVAKDAP